MSAAIEIIRRVSKDKFKEALSTKSDYEYEHLTTIFEILWNIRSGNSTVAERNLRETMAIFLRDRRKSVR